MDESQPNKYTAITDTVKILEFLDRKRTAEDVAANAAADGSSTNGSSAQQQHQSAEHHHLKDNNTNPARSLAPGSLASKARDDDIIKLTQSSAGDPNLLLLVARNEDELKAKDEGLPGQFVRGRKKALEGYLEELKSGKVDVPNKEKLEGFYTEKLTAMKWVPIARFSRSASLTKFFCFAALPAISYKHTKTHQQQVISSQKAKLTGCP